jgi:hypothetical protein
LFQPDGDNGKQFNSKDKGRLAQSIEHFMVLASGSL